MQNLPPAPDFAQIDAAAGAHADRRTFILSLIGNLVFSWSNNESMLIYVIMLLMGTDLASATIVFATLNTTRARIDLVGRIARAKIQDPAIARELDAILNHFGDCTRVRNEFNHCMYVVNQQGEITHTHAMRVQETKGGPRIGPVRPIDDKRIEELLQTIRSLVQVNREFWNILPVLEAHMKADHPVSSP